MNENIWEVETLIPTIWPNDSFAGKFSPNPYLKNMISTNRKDFPWKNGPNLPDFEEKKFYQSPDFQYIAKNVEGFWFFSTSILVHVAKFGYITLEMIATLVTSQNWKKKPWFGLNSLAPQTNNILLMSQQTWSHELKKRSNFPLLAPKTFLALTPSLKRALSEPTESCKSLATGTQFH